MQILAPTRVDDVPELLATVDVPRDTSRGVGANGRVAGAREGDRQKETAFSALRSMRRARISR